MRGPDKEFYDDLVSEIGSGVVGRGMYDAAGGWGGTNPFPGTLFVVTHRVEDQPPSESGFVFVDGLDAALDRAGELAGDRAVSLGGGADVIRQGLAAGRVDELIVSSSPVVLGGGKRLFDGFEHDLGLEILRTVASPLATHVRYAVRG
jgi:dihydrofolate reductase